MQRLRRLYYNDPKVNITYRRVRDVLRGHVDAKYHDYYERMMAAERATHSIIKNMHTQTHSTELLEQMQNLGLKVARLIEQLQNSDQIDRLYQPGSKESQMVAESRQWLEQHIEHALEIHAGIPARVMSFSTVAAGRGIEKLSERIARLTERLDDIADAYTDIDNYTPEHLRALIDDEIIEDENLSDRETPSSRLSQS